MYRKLLFLSLFSLATATQAESIGSYVNGCLSQSQALPLTGQAYQVIRPSRDRYYGHPRLVAYIEKLAAQVAAQGYGHLLIADMAQAHGGPMPSGHRSHQTGLDVDILLQQSPIAAQRALTTPEREALQPVSVLNEQESAIEASRWLPQQAEILRLAAESEEVARIFINPVIKQALCDAQPNAAWLAKLRPWWGHDGHFHVRLTCDPADGACQNQAPISQADNGCGSDLAWWFSPARWQQSKTTEKKKKPVLPAACQALLAEKN